MLSGVGVEPRGGDVEQLGTLLGPEGSSSRRLSGLDSSTYGPLPSPG